MAKYNVYFSLVSKLSTTSHKKANERSIFLVWSRQIIVFLLSEECGRSAVAGGER